MAKICLKCQECIRRYATTSYARHLLPNTRSVKIAISVCDHRSDLRLWTFGQGSRVNDIMWNSARVFHWWGEGAIILLPLPCVQIVQKCKNTDFLQIPTISEDINNIGLNLSWYYQIKKNTTRLVCTPWGKQMSKIHLQRWKHIFVVTGTDFQKYRYLGHWRKYAWNVRNALADLQPQGGIVLCETSTENSTLTGLWLKRWRAVRLSPA